MRVKLFGIVAVAIVAGLMAAFMMLKLTNRPAPEPMVVNQQVPVQVETVDVLVARIDQAMGSRMKDTDFEWKAWPKAGIPEHLVRRDTNADAITKLAGSITRVALFSGEPIREERMMKSDRGFMSVILSPGMRAVAIEVAAKSTAGGFILPNDHVDVVLTRAASKGQTGGDPFVSETILTNVRILAIDQQISEKEGQPAVIAKDTATLELTPRQSELILQALQMGTISLILRSVRDAEGTPESAKKAEQEDSSAVTVVRFGVATRTNSN